MDIGDDIGDNIDVDADDVRTRGPFSDVGYKDQSSSHDHLSRKSTELDPSIRSIHPNIHKLPINIMSSETSDKVIIIGGGLGGLALAQILHANKIPFEIFERDAEPFARGQGWAVALVE